MFTKIYISIYAKQMGFILFEEVCFFSTQSCILHLVYLWIKIWETLLLHGVFFEKQFTITV